MGRGGCWLSIVFAFSVGAQAHLLRVIDQEEPDHGYGHAPYHQSQDDIGPTPAGTGDHIGDEWWCVHAAEEDTDAHKTQSDAPTLGKPASDCCSERERGEAGST